MKLNYAPQVGLRRRRADNRREVIAFWAGILIVVAFEGVLMAKSWSPMSSESIFAFNADQPASDDAGADN